jgi:dipeptide/tripeptide permease
MHDDNMLALAFIIICVGFAIANIITVVGAIMSIRDRRRAKNVGQCNQERSE